MRQPKLSIPLRSLRWPAVAFLPTILFLNTLCAQTRPGQTAADFAAKVAIFYDGPDAPMAEGFLDAHQIQNLLGHFGLTGGIIRLDKYQAGSLAGFRAGFFVGTTTGTKFPRAFLDDVRGSHKPFCWIGRHVGNLVDTPEARRQFGFTYVDYRDDLDFREVQYKGVSLPKEDPDLNLITVSDPSLVQILATAHSADEGSRPYALRRDRFWYFADAPFSYAEEGDRYLVFCDLLHDILEIQHPASKHALVRIEDVSTEIDPDDLRQIANLLSRRNIPFQVGVIPIYRKPSQGIEVRLTDRPALVEALQYMIAHGGTPILHGVTHQYRGVTGDDYEFWDVMKNRPVGGDSADFVLHRLQAGLAECFAAGIFPVAFETPHYGATDTDYRAMHQVFQLFNERIMATPDVDAIQYAPYAVRDPLGRTVAPENLAYLPVDNPDPKVVIARARNLQVVRDGVASFYFHPFLNPALLADAVQGISALGYQFVSLRQFGGAVNFENKYLIATSSGSLRLAPDNEFWRLRVYDESGNLVRDQVSPERHTGILDIRVEIPVRGWAALETLRNQPVRSSIPGWGDQIRKWWNRVSPVTRAEPLRLGSDRSAWLLWSDEFSAADSNNQQSYRTVLETYGYRVKLVPLHGFSAAPRDPATVLVVPQAVGPRLGTRQQQLLLQYMSGGGSLIADGRQPWLSSMGFHWSDHRIPISTVVDVLFPDAALHWNDDLIERFTPPAGARQFMVDPQSRQVLAIGGQYGSGHYLYFAAPLDPYTPYGTSHYPYFSEYLNEVFQDRHAMRSGRVEVYFDPGFRQGIDLAHLAATWRQNGIRTVYVAAWQVYPRWSFDYASFVQLAHENGLSVYAWFVLPEVTPKMWEEHPEWRERTATGADGQVGWRLAMNFQNPLCFQAAMDWIKSLLAAHDWDGVNLTELNFDADFIDYRRPDRFVPMNDDVRAEFHSRSGFDPALLFATDSPFYYKRNPQAFEKFLQYREDAVTNWHRRVLEQLHPLQKARDWEVIVTMLDSLHSQYVRPALGVNSHRIVELMKDFEFTLQVEDPAEHWIKPPDRYRTFAQTYLPLVPDRRRLMFDINVLANRDVTGTALPSGLTTGTELAETVIAAASASGRVALYSEATVPSQDWAFINQALASSVRMESQGHRWSLSSPEPVRLISADVHNYYLDGQLWPVSSSEGVLVPPGRHQLSIERPWYRMLDRGEMPTRLLYANANLLQAAATPTGIELRYESPSRAVLLVNQRPMEIVVDGQSRKLPVQEAGGNWWLLAPRGAHQIAILTTTPVGVYVNLWSWLSSSTITTFGACTSFLMLALYAARRFRRVAQRRSAQ